MTRASDEQLELDFGGETKPFEQAAVSSDSQQVSGTVVCFASRLRLRLAREEDVKEAKLLEQIATRVQHFK